MCSHFPPSSSGGPRRAGPGSCALSPDARWEASQLETPVQLSKMVPGGGRGLWRDTRSTSRLACALTVASIFRLSHAVCKDDWHRGGLSETVIILSNRMTLAK